MSRNLEIKTIILPLRPYVNIHTHTASENSNVLELLNIYEGFDQINHEIFYSLGLHPWHMQKDEVENEWVKLAEACAQENVFAVGECGLDRVCATDFDLQRVYFNKQIELANALNKPLIIHCVRAHDELLHMLFQARVSVPVIFHGFNKSKEWADKILLQGYYLSFGQQVQRSELASIFSELPLNRVFLETDVASIDIESIYAAAASAKSINMEQLIRHMHENAELIFGKRFLHHE